MTVADPTAIPAARLVPTDRIHVSSWNPRTITRPRFKALMRSIAADPGLLWFRPALAQETTGDIYAGNMRYLAVVELWKRGCPKEKGKPDLDWPAAAEAAGIRRGTLPAVVEDVPDKIAKERAIRDNLTAGEWQDEQLSELAYSLQVVDSDLSALGWSDDDLASLSIAGPPGADAVPPGDEEANLPEPPVVPRTRRGDIWRMGEHLLVCGDGADRYILNKLLDGQKAALLLTDPPYNVGVEYGEQTDDKRGDYDRWTQRWYGIAREYAPHRVITVGSLNLMLWYRLFEPSHTGIWIKGDASTGQSKVTMFEGWEPIVFYGEGKWERKRHMDVFTYAGGAVPRLGHPCPKPLALWSDLVDSFSNDGDVVLDVFAGSGTTVLACEDLGRKARCVEIEPAFCDVICERWIRRTGSMPVRDDGVPFLDVAPGSAA